MKCARGWMTAFFLASALWPRPADAQDAIANLLFRVFLIDGRVLTSFGEYAKLDDRVVFSMPTRVRPEIGGLELVSIPSNRVDWPRTSQYSDRVHAAAYAATRGAGDFAALSADVARILNEVSAISDPGVRLVTAEKARQALAEWPNTHYGYKVAEVREYLSLLDGIIAELRVAIGQTRFNLAMMAPVSDPPAPPLPAPSDQEIVEQMMTAASLAATPVERAGLLQKVVDLLDSTVGLLLPEGWSARIRRTVLGDLEEQRRIERAYAELRTSTLAASAKALAKVKTKDIEKLRDHVIKEDARLGHHQPGDIEALVATLTMQMQSANDLKAAQQQWEKRAGAYRKYRRSMNGAFAVFKKTLASLDQVKSMTGPPAIDIDPLADKLAKAQKAIAKVTPPEELAASHALVLSAWELAQNALRLRQQSVAANNLNGQQQASSAAAGALMLYQKARTDLTTQMEKPTAK